jgi:hypothetical protein
VLDTVIDVGELTREFPAVSQAGGLGLWSTSIANVCELYDLPAAADAARERMRDYATVIGRCLDQASGRSARCWRRWPILRPSTAAFWRR